MNIKLDYSDVKFQDNGKLKLLITHCLFTVALV